jgi:insertion element IS1 protein InsB
MNCQYCKGICQKKGLYKAVQKYRCGQCYKYQRFSYRNRKYNNLIDERIKELNRESVGISSISRLLRIPKSSVQRRIRFMNDKVTPPLLSETNQVYEMDELYTFIGRKTNPCYVLYAINRKTKQVIDCVIGGRTKENINIIVQKLLSLTPKRIYTDKLNIFGALIPASVHRTFQYRTNCIERKNLTIRTHLKRMGRKTICYSKSKEMLEACFRLYVWR